MAVTSVMAQQISGVITDKEHGEPMPGVHIYYTDGKGSVAVSDVKGNYRIAARNAELVFSIIGYDRFVTAIEGKSQRLNVELVETSQALEEVEVVRKRKKYTRKDNPAVEMVRKVIAAKDSSDLYANDFFSYQKYEKMTLALNEFSDKVFEDDHFKRMPFLKEHVETCPETGKLILPLTIEEKVSRQIYRKDPKTEKTIVEGQRRE